MASTIVPVGSSVGLHARPAARISQAAAQYEDEILLELADAPGPEPSQADSSLMIMALGAAHGDRVRISSANATAVAEIAALIAADLDA
ncbi:HPr family phosphocarrier protein [Corynebacterium halotolerans]|uniref:HPr family phosphocarrier protein n=1 Tax=Corynebacterium halotolerans TaxID=225326 RepID=UPI003CF7E973